MSGLSRRTTIGAALAMSTAFLLCAPLSAQAQSTGRVHIKVAKVGFIVGVGGGNGTLTFKGKNYPFSVDGLSAGTIGVASAELVGTASNLNSPSDLAGTYSAAGAGLAVAGGARTITMQNARGVVLKLQGRQAGFEASLGAGGATITMK